MNAQSNSVQIFKIKNMKYKQASCYSNIIRDWSGAGISCADQHLYNKQKCIICIPKLKTKTLNIIYTNTNMLNYKNQHQNILKTCCT